MKRVKITRMIDQNFGKPEIQVNKTLQPVPRDEANLEAEKGETAVTPGNGGIPNHFKIGGKKHYEGGTPLNLPPTSFINSDSKDLKIKDPEILKQFGMPEKKSGFTPAEIAKKYDINKYKQMLADPDTDKIQRDTAEAMITNYNMKLGKLAIAQESMKGFPNGIPVIAMPYLEANQINPADFARTEATPDNNLDQPVQEYGGDIFGKLKQRKQGGEMEQYADGGQDKIILTKRPGDRYKLNPETGKVEVYNMFGKKIGVLQTFGAKGATSGEVSPAGKKTTTTTSASTTKKVADIPEGTVIKNASDPNLKVGDYIEGANGKIQKVTYAPAKFKNDDQRLGRLQGAYGTLENTVKDPGLQDKIYDNYKKHIQESKLPASRKEQLMNKPKNEVIDNYLTAQKQVYAIHNAGIDLTSAGAARWDRGTKKNEVYHEQIKKLGFKDNELLSDDQIAMFQAAHRGMTDAAADPEYKDTLSKFITPANEGMGDQTYGGKNISPVDDWFGNTTAGQAALPKSDPTQYEDVAMRDETIPGITTTTETGLPDNPPQGKAPWWLQDIIKTAGAASDMMRIKKYLPWQGTPGLELPRATFYDPTRELASNSENMEIGTRAIASFTGPQAFNARFSQIQGQGARAAADIMGRYNNLNVGIANQQENQNAAMFNQASANRAGLSTQLYDKYTIANQQFDNSKNQAREHLRQSYIDAVTNKNYTANLNDLYPQYNINPSVGGRIGFTKGRPVTPENTAENDVMAIAQQYLKDHPSFTPEQAFQAAKLKVYGAGKNASGNYPAQMGYPQ